jgi:ribose-phosphate pyrophosphokinase
MEIVIIGKPDFAGKIAQEIPSANFIELEERIFPDGEVCPRLLISTEQELKGTHAVIAMQLELNQCKNNYLISLLWTIYNVKRYNPVKITCFMPYHLYSRQDAEFRLGEPFSIQYLALALESAGLDSFLTINSHTYGKTKISHFFPNSQANELSAIPLLGEALKSKISSPKDVICFSPDEGAILLAKEAANALGTPHFCAIKKERDLNTGKITQSLVGLDIKIEDHSVMIIDDVVSSGGTMIGAVETLRDKGAKNVYLAYVHAVHSPIDFSRLLKVNPNLILTTNTVKSNIEGFTKVSIIPLIRDWILENS